MIESILLIKFIIAVSFILILSLIAEYISPRAAGLLSGLPTGTAITLFLFGLEYGPEFAAKSSTHNIVGMVALQTFIYIYYISSIYFKKFAILKCSIISIIGYILIVFFLNIIDYNIIGAIIINLLSIPLFIYLFRNIKDEKIGKKIKLKFNVLFFRAVISSSIILAVTIVAKSVGPKWAGLFSAFPTTVFPLLLIIHSTYNIKYSHTIIKNIPHTIFSIVIYSLGVYYLYPLIGIYWGTFIAYLPVILFLLVCIFLKKCYSCNKQSGK